MADYVAIVKKCEGDIVYTVEGNTSTTVNGNSVRGVWQHQYPIGTYSWLRYVILMLLNNFRRHLKSCCYLLKRRQLFLYDILLEFSHTVL